MSKFSFMSNPFACERGEKGNEFDLQTFTLTTSLSPLKLEEISQIQTKKFCLSNLLGLVEEKPTEGLLDSFIKTNQSLMAMLMVVSCCVDKNPALDYRR